MKACSGNRQKGAFGVVNINFQCIVFILSINESVQYHTATTITSFPCIAPIECLRSLCFQTRSFVDATL